MTLPGAAGAVSGQVIPGSPARGYGLPRPGPAGIAVRAFLAALPSTSPARSRGQSLTGPQPVFRANGTQTPVNGGHPGSGHNGANGSGAPVITYLTPPGSGYSLPDDDGDLL